ncbi:MAG: AraC family transcriptional regulator [Bacteroidota bacterium]|nr:AraC family transcriptional regulator [Bacteroidota bacterium]
MRHIETTAESFKSWTNANPYLHNPWHYHPELEITVIIKGKGTLFVGDKILNYRENELFLIGPNLPHEWRSDIDKSNDYYSQNIAVHFIKNFPGIDFEKIIEATPIRNLLKQSFMGIKVTEESTMKFVKEKLFLLIETKGIERINILFSILNAIATSSNLELLSSHSFVNSIDEGQNHKIIQVYKYVISNFKNQIPIDQVAQQVHMTSTSFCRFFKKSTNKSFIQYINEIRVGYSCKLLIEENYTISEAAYESGFENISNFNKQFKKIKKLTPTEFIALQSRK